MARVEATAIRRYLQQTFGVCHPDVTQSDPDKPALVWLYGRSSARCTATRTTARLSYALTVLILAEDLV